MDSELEKRLQVAFRDKLRLLPAELQAARGRPVAAQDPATLLPSSTRVLLKRREVAEVERELQNQRQEFQQRMQRLAQRREQLARRQEQHRDAVLSFDSFLKAVAARRERALRRAGEQRAAERAGAARLQRELEQLLRRRESLARRLRSLRPFGDYLRDVLASMGQESHWNHIQSTAIQKSLLLEQIKLAVLNLFQQTTAQLRIPKDRAQEDTKAQLDMLLLCMQGLADICAMDTHPQNHRSARLLRGQE
ncbi:cilia- and flagella-associated protein 73 isoform X4 [Catharus ustulatus]|uniref:cilia- and flagella-associated protein 73 isoform X4 n=1 Tax=Catharus ustulatus TaxID=91951 RepID=UPI001C5B8212|nr:cilia- and flagella-associated protein 73 isoform X4 [Catharus ustulatus]